MKRITLMPGPRIMRINAKCSDLFWAEFNGVEYDGYVPKFFPGEHYGDYVELDIDIDTGKIMNWKIPTQKELNDTFLKRERRE